MQLSEIREVSRPSGQPRPQPEALREYQETELTMPDCSSTSSLRSIVTVPPTAGPAGGGSKDPSTSRGWASSQKRTTCY